MNTFRTNVRINYRGSTSLQDVTAAACKAARKVGKEYSFTVTRPSKGNNPYKRSGVSDLLT